MKLLFVTKLLKYVCCSANKTQVVIFNKKYENFALAVSRDIQIIGGNYPLSMKKLDITELPIFSFFFQHGNAENLVLKDHTKHLRSTVENGRIRFTESYQDNSNIFLETAGNDNDSNDVLIKVNKNCLTANFTEKGSPFVYFGTCMSSQSQMWSVRPKSMVLESYKLPHGSITEEKNYVLRKINYLFKQSKLSKLLGLENDTEKKVLEQ